MTRRTLVALGVLWFVAIPPARGDVDLTGRWQFVVQSFDTSCLDIVQTGTALTATSCGTVDFYGSGTIDPVSGAFTIAHGDDQVFCPPPPPDPPPPCVTCGHAELDATATPDGMSFGGTVSFSVLVFPGLCSGGIDFGVSGTRVVCGDGLVQVTEQCDDGNVVDGDCCSSTCQYEPAGNACSADGSPCSVGECDATGTCVQEPPCRPAGRSTLLIKSPSDDPGDKVVWKWLRGPQTAQSDFGDPSDTTDYAFCLYAGTANAPLADATVPADATKWTPISTTGYLYKDREGSAQGITKVLLKGGDDGRSKALLKGSGSGLPDPALGNLPLPITARLVGSAGAVCLEAVYDADDVISNETTLFKAKAR